jgi:hypothetical protein
MIPRIRNCITISLPRACPPWLPDSRVILCTSVISPSPRIILISKSRYVLSRHLKREEVIDPPVELGKFRGEPVYPRSSVISLKTAENWMRQGRVVREGCQPMKMVKQRAVTIGRKREMELALEKARTDTHNGDGQEDMQGLYAKSQTELYKPDPVIDVCLV